MRENNKLLGILALTELNGIGPTFVKRAVTKNAFETSNVIEEIESIVRANKKKIDEDTIYNAVDKAKNIVFKCKEDGITLIDFTSIDYPFLLKQLKDPPPILYCKGNLELLNNKTVCIIGTRELNDTAIKISERISSYYSNNGWAICNGLAEGVDSYSIKANDTFYRKIIGVLAGGLNYNSKKTLLKKTAENAEKTIENGGLIVSENQPDKKEDTFSIVKSCRIQAGVSNGLILIQSSLDGGSRYTTKAFSETKRPIAVVNPIPSDIDLPSYNANKEIILNAKNGLVKFTELKPDKIQTSKIFIMRSKENYSEFETLIKNTIEANEGFNSSLFS